MSDPAPDATRLVPTPEEDGRHGPGSDPLPWWNESLWFPMFDPERDVGIVFRVGAFPVACEGELEAGAANCYLAILHRGHVVHQLVDHALPLPPATPDRIELANGLCVTWREPLQRFRLGYRAGACGFDLDWRGVSPPFLYPSAHGSDPQRIPRHVEQGGRVTGSVRFGGRELPFEGFGHRDHTWGGDRDWDRFHAWDYCSGSVRDAGGRTRWFNAVRIRFSPDMDWIRVGCLWDGRELFDLADLELEVDTAEGGSRAEAARCTLTDTRGRVHRFESEGQHGLCGVRIRRTWLRDLLVGWKAPDGARGYGVLEHGYTERPHLAEFV